MHSDHGGEPEGPFTHMSKRPIQTTIVRRNASAHEQIWRQVRVGLILALILSTSFVWYLSGDSFALQGAPHSSGAPVVVAKFANDFKKSSNDDEGLATSTHAPRRPTAAEAEASVKERDASEAECDLSAVPSSREAALRSFAELQLGDHREPWAASDTKRHLDAFTRVLGDAAPCLRKVRGVLHSSQDATDDAAKIFIDLGSRELDSSQTFLAKFPDARRFHIHCFEANPKFAKAYAAFASSSPDIRLTYHGAALGVENTTLTLSDRSVGSSVVLDGAAAAGGGASAGTQVPVVDVADFMVREIVPEIAAHRDSYVVVKMDIEKMEFAVLHRLARLGLLAVIDDLLLECHYNTNKPRAQRDPTKHIGLDDCKKLVDDLNAHLGTTTTGSRRFVAVLWNSPKTARSSGYGASHGGFFPT